VEVIEMMRIVISSNSEDSEVVENGLVISLLK
jgi:hypothetical protein